MEEGVPSSLAEPAVTTAPAAAVSPAPNTLITGSGDILLDSLVSAQSRLRFLTGTALDLEDSSGYHGMAVTSLVPAGPSPSPPLREDAVSQAMRPSETASPPCLTSSAVDNLGKKRGKMKKPLSRRQQVHQQRIEAALSSHLLMELDVVATSGTVGPSLDQHQGTDAFGVRQDLDTHQNPSSSRPRSGGVRPPGLQDDHPEDTAAEVHPAKQDGEPSKARRRRKHRTSESASAAPLADGGNEEEEEVVQLAASYHDYNPDNPGAVAEKIKLLQEQHRLGEGEIFYAHDGTPGAAVAFPTTFSSGSVPPWLREYCSLLLFDSYGTQQLSLGCCSRGENNYNSEDGIRLPIDSVILRLQRDLEQAKELLRQVRKGSDGGLMAKSAKDYEVYNPVTPSLVIEPPQEDAVSVVNSKSRSEDSRKESVDSHHVVFLDGASPGGSGIQPSGTQEYTGKTPDSSGSRLSEADACGVSIHSAPLLSAVEELRDLQRPILSQVIPLWRRCGAAERLLIDLVALLESRLASLAKQLGCDERRRQLERVGFINSSGVDGTIYHGTLPAIQRAMEATITSTLIGDLFASRWAALDNRAMRLSEALRRRQTPYIHKDFITRIDARPRYDYLQLQKSLPNYGNDATLSFSAQAMVLSLRQRRGGDGGSDPRKSYTIHVDYVRFQPFVEAATADQLPHELGALTVKGQFSKYANASTSSEDPLSSMLLGSYTSLFLESQTSLKQAAGSLTNTPQQHQKKILWSSSSAASAALLLSLSIAATRSSLVSFSPEAYLTAILLQYYEQYRLLQLNLLPFLKNRFFYQEQLLQLQRQSQRSPDLDTLESKLKVLSEKSAAVERSCLHAMITLWRAVLDLRRRSLGNLAGPTDQDDTIFVSHPLRSDTQRHRSTPWTSTPPLMADEQRPHPPIFPEDHKEEGEGATFTIPHRQVVQETALMTPDGTNKDEHTLFCSPQSQSLTHPAIHSPLLSPTTFSSSAGSYSAGPDTSIAYGAAAPVSQFRFYLRRYGTQEEAPYVLGDDLLRYAAEVQGTDVTADITRTTAGKSHAGDLLFFQIAVFTRSHAATVPQYVGCTAPRPMTTSNAIFFNETFEIRALREPAEILMHLIPVTAGPYKGTVVATTRVTPTLTRRYSLVPLQAPTAFMFHGKLFSRCQGTAVHGVVAISTTWTSSQGLTPQQMEQLFLSGAADPLDPEYAPLLRVLRNYYAEAFSATTAAPLKEKRSSVTHRASTVGEEERAERRLRRRQSSLPAVVMRHGGSDEVGTFTRHHSMVSHSRLYRSSFALRGKSTLLLSGVGSAVSTRPGSDSSRAWGMATSILSVAASAVTDVARLPTERLQRLLRRWLIRTNRIKATDEAEARLYERPIPLSEEDGYEVLKDVRRAITKEEAVRKKEYGETGDLFDIQHYYSRPSAISGLALSPLSQETKLRLWQENQRRLKLTQQTRRHMTDEEKLGEVVKLPKFSAKLVLDFTPRSQLNPRRNVRPKTEDIDRALLKRRQDSHIVIHIMKAYNLPYREDNTPLEPFVQASFVSEAAYTRSEVGSSPSWFQTLELPFQPLDFEEDTLSLIDDDIVISVYDKVEVKMAPLTVTTGAMAHETHYRTERRFIGTLRIPFYSLHQADQARMEGVYPITMPRWILGYGGAFQESTTAPAGGAVQPVTPPEAIKNGSSPENPFGNVECVATNDATPASVVADNNLRHQEVTRPTVQLYISLWPPLQREPQPPLTTQELTQLVNQLNVSPQLGYLHDIALKWKKTALKRMKSISSLNAMASHRIVEPFVECSTGDYVLMCRYLLPHGGPPPQSVTTVYEAIRYVSLLPFVGDILSWGRKDVWSTNMELLSIRSGDYEELALLLAHFMRFLVPDRPTYVVVGSGSIYEQAIMVLHAFSASDWYLIDPRSGWTVSATTPYGTMLRDVHIVISHDQLWANTQLSGLPHRMTWDLHNPVHWLPCFDAEKDTRVAKCLPFMSPIQREVLPFPPVDPVKSKEIELELSAVLKKSLQAWRHGSPPPYHRGVEAILRELLISAEAERCLCGSAHIATISASAVQKLSEYFGEPVTLAAQDPTFSPESIADRNGQQATQGAVRTAPYSSGGPHHRHRRRGRHHIIGSPVMGSYNSADPEFQQLLQQVFECAVHEVGTNDVSFAAGIYVKSYAGDVCSMWVFLVAICRG